MPLQIQLEGKVALVTGASRGIGKQIATAMATAGASVILNDIDPLGCDRAATEIREATLRTVTGVVADISNQREVQAMIGQALQAHPQIDILVNNAGVIVRKPAIELSESEWDRILNVNLKGTFLCSQAVARKMIEGGTGGRIINIASVMGEVALPPRSAYCSSKGGVIALTRDLAAEWAPHGINVNAIAPGWVETELTKGYFAQEGVRDYLLERIPLRRFCQSSEVAALAAFLASDLANYITGQTICVDGGWTSL